VTVTSSVTVVVCAYTQRRWRELLRAVESVLVQTVRPDQVVVVVDHEPVLAERLERVFTGVEVLRNRGVRGLSAARNTGLRASHGEVVAFLDDDATAGQDWLQRLLEPYADPRVLAVGGSARPRWASGGRPAVLPGELDWVVGCSYTGLPRHRADVRNLMGCNMSFRRAVFDRVGGFAETVGRVGTTPLGCEETELCIRARRAFDGGRIVFEPAATVDHHVPPERTSWAYLARRSWAEGRSKALISSMVGRADALESERDYVRRVLPGAVLRELPRKPRAAAAIALSVGCAAAGYAIGRTAAPAAPPGEAVRVLEWDVRRGPEHVVVPESYRTAQVLVRDGRRTRDVLRRPVVHGVVDLSDVDRSGADTGRSGTWTPPVSIVVPTADRGESVAKCVKSLLDTGYPRLQVLVVDNRPTTPSVRALQALAADDARVRVLIEPVPGVSRARNLGWRTANGALVGFVDDDIEVDHWWLHNLVAELADPRVDCATSLVLPVALETPAQLVFEQLKGFGQGVVLQRWGPEDRTAWTRPGRFGPGGCALWRRSALVRLDGFDPLLGPGTPCRGAEDLELFLRLVRSGGTVVYAPDAVAWHEHEAELADLRAKLRAYATGLTAMYLRHVLRRPGDAVQIAAAVPAGFLSTLSSREPNRAPSRRTPRRLVFEQLRGVAEAPRALGRSFRNSRR
jgi:GT2 family glycosyltransferase